MASSTAGSYDIVDPELMAWAQRHSLEIQKLYRDDPVRSVWITGPGGKAQIWLGWPISAERIEIFAAKLDLTVREKWSSRANRVASLRDFGIALDEIYEVAAGWIATSS
jgi:hypothetical protein